MIYVILSLAQILATAYAVKSSLSLCYAVKTIYLMDDTIPHELVTDEYGSYGTLTSLPEG